MEKPTLGATSRLLAETLACPSCGGRVSTCLGCGARVDLLRLVPAGSAVLVTDAGAEIIADPSPPHPVLAGVVLTPAVVEALAALHAVGLTVEDALARVRAHLGAAL